MDFFSFLSHRFCGNIAKHIPSSIPFISINGVIVIPFFGLYCYNIYTLAEASQA